MRPQAGGTGYRRSRRGNWRGRVLVSAAWTDAKLAAGDYFIQDLIGLRVVDAGDPSVEYGVVEDVRSTGANDVYHIAREGQGPLC